MKGVRSVGFEHTDVTAAGFAAVATLPELKQVGFYNTWVNDDCWLDALASSQTLEVVRVHDHFQPPFFSVPKILALPHLRKLRLVVYVLEENRHVDDGRRWTDLAFDDLKRATSLEELELGGEFAQAPDKLVELQEELSDCKVSVVQWRGHEEVLKPVAELTAH